MEEKGIPALNVEKELRNLLENKESRLIVDNPIEDWPDELIPKAVGKFICLVQLGIKAPESFNVSSGGIIIPSQGDNRKFAFNVYCIANIGPDVGKSMIEADMNYQPSLKVGQWVHVMQATEFVWWGKKYFTCYPQFVSCILKQPEVHQDSLFKIFLKATKRTVSNVVNFVAEKVGAIVDSVTGASKEETK